MGNPNPLMRFSQLAIETERRTLPEAILVKILARLPLRSIARFKLLCKNLKSIIESTYFRRLFISLHRNSSTSWSLMFRTVNGRPITEAIGFYGCKTWDLPKSIASYIMPLQRYSNLPTITFSSVAYSSGLISISISVISSDRIGCNLKSFVGNPVLQQWVEIPPPPNPCVDEDGIVSSFKLIRTCQRIVEPKDRGMYVWRVCVYSSETGLWTYKRLLSSHPVNYFVSMSLNGMLYLQDIREGSTYQRGVLIAHDFYGPESDDHCRVVPLPGSDNSLVKRCLTSSVGDVIYIELLYRKLKVWRLTNSESESWQLSRKFSIWSFGCVDNCFPMAMNPFDTDIVYLWSQRYCCFISVNLQTKEFSFLFESETWSCSECSFLVNTADWAEYIEDNCDKTSVLMLSQFVLPRWMDSVPRPPN